MELEVKIGNKTLANPVGVASGTFGYGEEYDEVCDLSKVGAIYTKAISLEPRRGNPTPRIVETPSGMLNAIGLANVGVEKFISDKLPFLSKNSPAIIPNVAGTTEEDYCGVIERLDDIDSIWGYEINLSCPNVKHGALAFGTDPKMVEQITKKMRDYTKKPLIIKLSPNVTDITSIAKAAEAGGADAVSCINTLIGMVIDTKKASVVLANKTGGLSGPAIRPVGVAMVYNVSRAIDIPVIGIGGITSADDAIQYLLAGATAIQVGTWNFVEPGVSGNISAGIKEYMLEKKLSSISDFSSLLK
jgi:dihydroorotate dehydrogenase (NAD+) catalytic subunit